MVSQLCLQFFVIWLGICILTNHGSCTCALVMAADIPVPGPNKAGYVRFIHASAEILFYKYFVVCTTTHFSWYVGILEQQTRQKTKIKTSNVTQLTISYMLTPDIVSCIIWNVMNARYSCYLFRQNGSLLQVNWMK